MKKSTRALRIFLLLYVTISIISPAASFRCYVCSSLDDPFCYDSPKLMSTCPYLSTGCIRLEAQETQYDFRLPNGKSPLHWDGNATNWEVVPSKKSVVVRKCSNTYARYKYNIGCKIPPMAVNKKEGWVCYCEDNLCNGGEKLITTFNWFGRDFIGLLLLHVLIFKYTVLVNN